MITQAQIVRWSKPIIWEKGSGHYKLIRDAAGNEVGRIPMGHSLTQPEMAELCRLALVGAKLESASNKRRKAFPAPPEAER